MSSDELQQKAQLNLQSLGENGYCAENIQFVSTDKVGRKVHICLHWIFMLFSKCTAMQSDVSL